MSWLADQASEAIYRAGGRMTGQRQLIIELLETAEEHLDADGIYQRVRQQDASISLATVYRTLSILEEAGLIQPRYRSPEHERKYYETIHAEAEYHFTCRVCRRVIPFKSALINELKQKLGAEHGFEVLNACICLDGLCATCREKAAAKAEPPIKNNT